VQKEFVHVNFFKKIFGKALDGITQAISFLLDVLISIIEAIVQLVNYVGKGILGLLDNGWLFAPFFIYRAFRFSFAI
jgi:phage-related protein